MVGCTWVSTKPGATHIPLQLILRCGLFVGSLPIDKIFPSSKTSLSASILGESNLPDNISPTL